MEQRVRIEMRVSTVFGWPIAAMIADSSSAPQGRMSKDPSDSVKPFALARFLISGCIVGLGSRAMYRVTFSVSM